MPKNTQLSEIERGKVLAFRNCGMTGYEIAKRINRSKTVVYNYLKNPGKYGQQKRTGRPSSLTVRQKRAIVRTACSKNETSNQIRRELQLPCTSRTVRNVLQKNPNVRYAKVKSHLPLTKQHKTDRVEFAKKHVSFGTQWEDVVFSDEKKFNLDGPDGFRYYWHDIRKDKALFTKRQFGGGSAMVWGGFAAKGTTPIVFMQCKTNSQTYLDILAENLLPEAPLITSGEYLFQQDNASIHVSAASKSWFQANSVKLLDWPARSPDLNPMENLWGILAREVYKNGTQYKNKHDLMSAIKLAWEKIPKQTLTKLSQSMTARMINVIEKKGDFLNY